MGSERRHLRRFGAVLCVSGTLASCSATPDLKDIPGLSTYEVVRRIRCEMRDALRERVRRFVKRYDEARAEALQGDAAFKAFDIKSLAYEPRTILARYESALVGYDFNFEITENNNYRLTLGLLRSLQGDDASGPLSLSWGGTNDHERKNIENFRILDKFENLLRNVTDKYCNPESLPGEASFQYPISGHLGLDTYLLKFLNLNETNSLGVSPTGASIDSASPVAKYSVQLKFTTTLSSGFGAKSNLTATRQWQLGTLDASKSDQRQDIHSLSLVFVIPKPEEKPQPQTETKPDRTAAVRKVIEELDYLRTTKDIKYIQVAR